MTQTIREGLSFDDVLIAPKYSDITPSEVSTVTRITNKITLSIPIISAAMDTVTDMHMAISMSKLGGLGILHRNMSYEEQAGSVTRIKNFSSNIVQNPVTINVNSKVNDAISSMCAHNISGVLVVDDNNCLVGIVTARDIKSYDVNYDASISTIMTENVIIAPVGTSRQDAENILYKHRIEKLPVVKDGKCCGLITLKDLQASRLEPNVHRDAKGRVIVGAAVGLDFERVQALVDAEVDILCIDTSHGHTKGVMDFVRRVKSRYDIDIMAGNISGYESAKALHDAGADVLKVGMGPGAICTTRIISGTGVPQLTALLDVGKYCKEQNVPMIADGGMTYSGDITKALACGASAVMLGYMLAGTDEAASKMVSYNGKQYKKYRGMGSVSAFNAYKDKYGRYSKFDDFVPEGIESHVPYKGSLKSAIHQIVGGVKAGMGYVGAKDLSALVQNTEFIRITNKALDESHARGFFIHEAPNYSR